jgi:hypothetical protein
MLAVEDVQPAVAPVCDPWGVLPQGIATTTAPGVSEPEVIYVRDLEDTTIELQACPARGGSRR